jgi:hypothetical protein
MLQSCLRNPVISQFQSNSAANCMPIFENITQTIGRTPLIKLSRIGAGLPATIALKSEFFNPLGSVKDRIGLAMIDVAEKEGRIGPGAALLNRPLEIQASLWLLWLLPADIS